METTQNLIKKKTRPNGNSKRKRKAIMSQYSMIIQWLDEDNAFIVSLPEFAFSKTHGDSYQEAVQNGQEMIESLMEFYRQEQKPLPIPQKFSLA